MKTKKYISMLLAAVLLLSCLAGCGSSAASANKDSGKDAENRDDVIVAINTEPINLCPENAPQVMANMVCRQMYEPLVKSDRSGKVFYPGIATEWKVSDDATYVDFTIRTDVKFHNGELLTADDVVFSYDECMRLGVCETETALYDHMEKIDDTHLRLYLKAPFVNIMVAVGSIDLAILCKSAYEANPDEYYRNPIGCGPYKFVEWKSGESISLTRFDDYYGDAPAIKDVTFKIIQDDSAASMALQNGEIDLTISPPSADKNRIEADPNLKWDGVTGYNNSWIFFNYGTPDSPFNDKNVRLAVAYAIDKEAGCKAATDGLGTPAYDCVYGPWQGYTHEGYMAPQNDVEKAKELMAASAYPNGFDVEVVTTNNPRYYKIWEVVQPMLAEIGINVSISKTDAGTWLNDVFWAGGYTMNGWQASQGFADFSDHVVCWRSGAFLNAGQLSDAHLDELLDAQSVATKEEDRLELIREAMEYMSDEAYLVPLWNYPNFVAYNAKLQGVEVGPQNGNVNVFDWSWGA